MESRHQLVAGLTDGVPRAREDWRQGRVPLRLRAGVTGHRRLSEDNAPVAAGIRGCLDQAENWCRTGTAVTPVALTVVSALAEGADRLVAWQALERGARLEVVLPLPRDDYLTDFTSEESQDEFRELLGRAAVVTELPSAGKREEAYERAGRMVVDRSDVVLAVWDGRASNGRGGTAEIVSYARRRRVPVLRVAVARPGQAAPRPSGIDGMALPDGPCPLSEGAFAALDKFNASPLPSNGRRGPADLLAPELLATAPPHVQRFVDYAQPYFRRADHVAQYAQGVFLRLTRLLYALAAMAVVVVATQIIFFSDNPTIVWAEVLALVAVIITLVLGRKAGWHDRWLAARYLAERIRCSVFLTAVGAGEDPRRVAPGPRQPGAAEPVDPHKEWAERAFREIYHGAPRYPVPESAVPGLRTLLTEAWIDDQIGYHQSARRRLSGRQRRLTWLAITLFAVSAVVALLHSMRLLEHQSSPDVWGYLSVVIPAIGAALSGYGAQREYARLAERSRLMVYRLGEARELVRRSKRISSLQQAASSIDLLMRSETIDWYEVVRLHDFDVPG